MEFEAQEILPGLWLGSEKAGENLEALKSHGIKRVFVPARTGCPVALFPDHITYRCYAVADLGDFSIGGLLDEFFSFVDAGPTLVHCAQGKSRSAAFVIAYVMRAQRCSFSDAEHFVRKKRNISTKFEAQLLEFEKNPDVVMATKRHPFCAKAYFSN